MLFLFAPFAAAFLSAATPPTKRPGTPVEAMLSDYRLAPALEARVKKTVVQEVMETTNESDGKFYFSKGKLRLDFVHPERSTLLYDGKVVWLESRLDDKHVQVSRVKSGALRKSNSLLAALFDRKDALAKFRLLKHGDAHGLRTFQYEPLDKKSTEVRWLEIVLGEHDLHSIAYKDQMGNKVDFQFHDLKRGPVPAGTFTYHPPRGASVTNL